MPLHTHAWRRQPLSVRGLVREGHVMGTNTTTFGFLQTIDGNGAGRDLAFDPRIAATRALPDLRRVMPLSEVFRARP